MSHYGSSLPATELVQPETEVEQAERVNRVEFQEETQEPENGQAEVNKGFEMELADE